MERQGRATAGISGHVELIKRERGAPHAILTDARQLPGAVTTGATFADAAAESLRYVENDRKRRMTPRRCRAHWGRSLRGQV